MNVFVLLASACPYSRSYVAPSFHFQNCDRSIGISAIPRKTCLCFCLCLCLCSSENQPLLPTELSGNKDWNEKGPKPVCLRVSWCLRTSIHLHLRRSRTYFCRFVRIKHFVQQFCWTQQYVGTLNGCLSKRRNGVRNFFPIFPLFF